MCRTYRIAVTSLKESFFFLVRLIHNVRTEKYFRNLVDPNQKSDCIYHFLNDFERNVILFVITLFRLIWPEAEFSLVPNQPEKCYYNPNLV